MVLPDSAAVPETYHQRQFALPAGATEVILVRHGASEPATPGKPFPLLDGHGDPALAPEGQAQALAVAEHLAGEGLSALFVTTLGRTHQTAAPLAERTGLDPAVVPSCARSRSASGRAASSASASRRAIPSRCKRSPRNAGR